MEPELANLPAGLKAPAVSKAVIAPGADNQVVEHVDSENPPGLDHRTREVNVLGARFGIT